MFGRFTQQCESHTERETHTHIIMIDLFSWNSFVVPICGAISIFRWPSCNIQNASRNETNKLLTAFNTSCKNGLFESQTFKFIRPQAKQQQQQQQHDMNELFPCHFCIRSFAMNMNVIYIFHRLCIENALAHINISLTRRRWIQMERKWLYRVYVCVLSSTGISFVTNTNAEIQQSYSDWSGLSKIANAMYMLFKSWSIEMG